jgi:predicted nucleotidyltransferase
MNHQNNPVADALIRLGSAAQAAGLPHLIIGGNAVIHHGVPRFTRDVDFLIPIENGEAWRILLESLKWQLYHSAGAFAQYHAQSTEGCMPPVDLMMVDASTWKKLSTTAETETISENYTATWPSPLHLIALKLHAWRGEFRTGRERDWSDIVGLIQHCHIDLHNPSVREIITRYGGDDALTQLDKI